MQAFTRRIICSSALFAFLMLSAAPAFAATLVVDNDFADCPQADFNSIQAAIVAAQPGDKILVCPGVYPESVVVNKNDLRIEAQAAPGEVVLQGTPAHENGFHLFNTTGVLVQGFTIQGFRHAHIMIDGGSGNTLRKNVTTDSATADGIAVINSSANVVEQNRSFDNRGPLSDGIELSGATSSNNIIRHNETFQNGVNGILVISSGRGNVVFSNNTYRNPSGILNVARSNGNVIEHNQVFENGRGIVIGNSTDTTVRHNRSQSNTEFGIRLQNGSSNNLVEKNEVFQNTLDGIRLEGGPLVVANNIVRLNLLRQNGRDGIRVNATSGVNTFERNVIRESGEHDAHDDSIGPGTGGTANFWINNKCETENRPELCKNPDL